MPKKPGVAGDALSNRHKNQPHCRHFRHWDLRKTDRGARGRGWGQCGQNMGESPKKGEIHMKLKNMWKRFWTLDVHNHAGFTLVELIIVIAILAILSTGAIAGYSAYVEKANMTADKALASEIANVLTLHAYSNGIGEGGYVILSANGNAKAEGAEVIAALQDAYGSNWQSALKLKYSNWSNDGLLDYVLQNADSASLIANSTYLTTATPEGLMNAVTGLTDAAATVFKNYTGNLEGALNNILGQEFIDKLGTTGYDKDDEEYETVISNMLVGHFSNQLHGSSYEEIMGREEDDMLNMILVYAELYAYCETNNDSNTINALNSYLAGATSTENLTAGGLYDYLENETEGNFNMAEFEGFFAENGADDINAVLEILGAVHHVSGSYTADQLANPDLYSSGVVAEQLNNYITAIKSVASGMDLSNLNAGAHDVTIFVAKDGTIAIMPDAVRAS